MNNTCSWPGDNPLMILNGVWNQIKLKALRMEEDAKCVSFA
jgi:hypothetical protein